MSIEIAQPTSSPDPPRNGKLKPGMRQFRYHAVLLEVNGQDHDIVILGDWHNVVRHMSDERVSARQIQQSRIGKANVSTGIFGTGRTAGLNRDDAT